MVLPVSAVPVIVGMALGTGVLGGGGVIRPLSEIGAQTSSPSRTPVCAIGVTQP